MINQVKKHTRTIKDSCFSFSKISTKESISNVNNRKNLILETKESDQVLSKNTKKSKKIKKPNDYLFFSVFTSIFCFLPLGKLFFPKI